MAYAGQHWDEDVGLSYAQQRWYSPESGRFLSEDPVFGDLQNPSSLNAFGYGNGNPLSFIDPRGTQSSTNDIGLALMWQQVGAELSAMWESMVGGKAHVLPAQNYVEHTPAKGGVGGLYGGVVRTASLRLIPMEENASEASKVGMEVGAGFVPFLNPAEKLVTGETVTSEPTSRFWAAVELGLDAAPLVPKAYKAATKALGAEARAARAAARVAEEAEALGRVAADATAGEVPLLRMPKPVGADVYRIRVRHYTRKSSLEPIRESGVIRAGDKGSVFAVPAKGKPGSPRDIEQALGIKPGKGGAYVEFDAKPGEFAMVTNRRTGARELVFRGSVALEERNPIFGVNR